MIHSFNKQIFLLFVYVLAFNYVPGMAVWVGNPLWQTYKDTSTYLYYMLERDTVIKRTTIKDKRHTAVFRGS